MLVSCHIDNTFKIKLVDTNTPQKADTTNIIISKGTFTARVLGLCVYHTLDSEVIVRHCWKCFTYRWMTKNLFMDIWTDQQIPVAFRQRFFFFFFKT